MFGSRVAHDLRRAARRTLRGERGAVRAARALRADDRRDGAAVRALPSRADGPLGRDCARAVFNACVLYIRSHYDT